MHLRVTFINHPYVFSIIHISLPSRQALFSSSVSVLPTHNYAVMHVIIIVDHRIIINQISTQK